MNFKVISAFLAVSLLSIMLIGAVSAEDISLRSSTSAQTSLGAGVIIDSKVNVTNDGNLLQVTLKDGTMISVLANSEEARNSAALRFGLKNCNNCTIKMEERRYNGEAHAVYNVGTKKEGKVFGFFNTEIDYSAYIDAKTGTILSVEKPWWSFLATIESDTSIEAN